MVCFKEIKATKHYLEKHQEDVPWEKVIEILLAIKNPRKKDGKFEINTREYYVLFDIRDKTLYVINAKRK